MVLKRSLRGSLSVLALLVALCPSVAFAERVAVRAGARGEGVRLVFEWPGAVVHTSRLSGNSVLLSFDHEIQANLSSLSGAVPGWVKSAVISANGKGVTITLGKPARMNSFASGNKVVVDLSPAPAQQQQAQATPPASPHPATVRIGRHEDFTRAVMDFGAPARLVRESQNRVRVTVRTTRRLSPAELEKLRIPQVAAVDQSVRDGRVLLAFTLKPGVRVRDFRSAGGIGLDFIDAPPPIPAPVAEARPAVTPPPASVAQVEPPPAAGPEEAKPESPAAEPAKPEEHHALPQEEQDVETPAAQVEPQPVSAPPVAGVVQQALPEPGATLPAAEMHFAAPTPVAVFRRGGALFVVVSTQDAPRDLVALVGASLAASPAVKLLPAEGGRVVRVDLSALKTHPNIQSLPNGWKIVFDAPEAQAVKPLEVETQPDYALGPRLLLRSAGAGNPVTFVDPVVGDTLTAVPVPDMANGVVASRSLVQADILPTLQGVAVAVKADGLSVITSSMGVEISAAGGLKLSEKLQGENVPVQTAQMEAPPIPVLPPLFDFSALGQPAGASFIDQRQALHAAIAVAPQETRNNERLKLAQFFFINGMPTEAAAVWSLVAQNQPDLGERPEYALLRAIAAFSSGSLANVKAAMAGVNQPTTDAALWRAALAVRERDWVTASEQFRVAIGRIKDYPEPYVTRLQIAAIETALNTEDYVLAESLLKSLTDRQRANLHRLTPAAEYLTGLLDWQQNKADEARARLNSAARSWDQQWRVRAQLALIEADLKENKVTPEEAIKRLERLRFAWRGDALEFDMMHRLADLHVKLGDYAAAFEDYSKLAEKFPDDPRTPGLPEEQRTAFTRIFQGEERDKTPAFSQLAIWDKYADFRPTQQDVLDEIRLYLADRSAGIDLLDRAVGFYGEVMANVKDPVVKAGMGVKVAAMRLLDNKPDEALKVLQETLPAATAGQPSPLSEAMRDERRILEARALSGQGKPEEALKLLVSDYSEPAMRLRADVTWRTRRWAEAAAAFDALIGESPAEGQSLAEDKARLMVSRATALALAGDVNGIAEMRGKFGAAMAQTPEAATFQILTRPESAGGLADRTAVLQRVAEVDLFQKFLEQYRSAAPSGSAESGQETAQAH